MLGTPMLVSTVQCCNKVVLELLCCSCDLVVLIELSQSAIYYILVMRIGRSFTSLNSARFWDHAVCCRRTG